MPIFGYMNSFPEKAIPSFFLEHELITGMAFSLHLDKHSAMMPSNPPSKGLSWMLMARIRHLLLLSLLEVWSDRAHSLIPATILFLYFKGFLILFSCYVKLRRFIRNITLVSISALSWCVTQLRAVIMLCIGRSVII